MNHRMRMVVTIRPAVPDIYAPYLTSRGVIVKSEEAEVYEVQDRCGPK